jgi:hypothetical protein
MVEQQATDTLRPFLDQLSEALSAVANGDPEPMKALCRKPVRILGWRRERLGRSR